MKFINKIVIVTGATGGIAKEITTRFLHEGAKEAAVDISTEALEKMNIMSLA